MTLSTFVWTDLARVYGAEVDFGGSSQVVHFDPGLLDKAQRAHSSDVMTRSGPVSIGRHVTRSMGKRTESMQFSLQGRRGG